MWQWGVRPEIQKWLKEHDPKQKIRCLVTVWGVPLKIGPAAAERRPAELSGVSGRRAGPSHPVAGSDPRRARQGGSEWRIGARGCSPRRRQARGPGGAGERRCGPLVQIHRKPPTKRPARTAAIPPGDKLSGQPAGAAPGQPGDAAANPTPGEPADQPADGSPEKKLSEIDQLRAGLEKALQDAQARLAKLPPGDVRTRGQLQLHQLASAAGGGNVILQGISQRLATVSEPEPELKTEFDMLRGRTIALAEVKSLLDQTAPDIERNALQLALMERLTGIIGTVEWIDMQLNVVRQNETGAAFDSELSLVMWPDNYQLLRWQPNYLRPGFDNSQLPKVYRTLMVVADRRPDLGPGQGPRSTRRSRWKRRASAGKVYYRQPRHRRAHGRRRRAGQLCRLRSLAVDHGQGDRRD